MLRLHYCFLALDKATVSKWILFYFFTILLFIYFLLCNFSSPHCQVIGEETWQAGPLLCSFARWYVAVRHKRLTQTRFQKYAAKQRFIWLFNFTHDGWAGTSDVQLFVYKQLKHTFSSSRLQCADQGSNHHQRERHI